ncbi:hypothetical protein A3K63_05085 [Candidatus Micrarchaeota archaeon RBG_16_49_10]|nr:MAG: hypothetical protein A3K63_05085 [Candidatus Micrarchaeota archaeon RBG_16_49_10]
MKTVKLDEKDLRILKDLERDGKKSLKDVSDSMKLSMTSVFERIKKLEKGKVIRGYKAVLDREKLDKGSTALLLAKVSMQEDLREVAKRVSAASGVSEVFIVNGKWSLVAKLRGKDAGEIAGIVLDNIRQVKGIEGVEVFHVWETVKESGDILN